MRIEEKINLLKEYMYKASIDSSYKESVNWPSYYGKDIEEIVANISNTINEGQVLFLNDTIRSLNYSIKTRLYVEWNKKIEQLLICFPEYEEIKNNKILIK